MWGEAEISCETEIFMGILCKAVVKTTIDDRCGEGLAEIVQSLIYTNPHDVSRCEGAWLLQALIVCFQAR